MTAKELLSSIQIAYNTTKGNKEFYDEFKIFNKEHKYDIALEQLETSNKKMPTDYQESHFYNMIEDSFIELQEVVNKKPIVYKGNTVPVKPIPLYGTIELNSFNAFIISEDDVPVIIFNNGLLKLTQMILGLVTKELYLTSRKLMDDKRKIAYTKNLIDILMCFHLTGNAYAAIPSDYCDMSNYKDMDNTSKIAAHIDCSVFGESYMLFYQSVKESTYLWMAAHEYSHLILSHFDSNAYLAVDSSICNIDVKQINYQWRQEYEADILAAVITMESNGLYDVFGIYIALAALLFAFIYENDVSCSHPPTQLRIEKVVYALEKNIKY